MEAVFTAPPTTETYVDLDTFNAAIQRLEHKLNEALNQVSAADARSKEALQRAEQESRERTAELSRLQSEITSFRQGTEARLGGIQDALNNLGGSIGRLTGIMETWNEVVKAREKAFEDSNARIDKVEAALNSITKDVDLLTISQTGYSGDLKHLKGLIVGDPATVDAPPSLFGTVKDIDARIRAQDLMMQEIFNTSKNNSNRIETIILQQQEEKQRRAERLKNMRKAVISALKAFVKNPWLYLVLGSSGTIGLIASVAPQLAPFLESLLDLLR
jgi:septal ring factor EnvC (AmiA/AmiB activator)